MKRYLLTIIAIVTTTFGLKAMPYEMAREEAIYLTDKMAYELNLNQRQYEYAYEINLDYFMGLNRPEDAYGVLWVNRNEDLRHVLYEWQWKIFMAVDYFLRPVTWRYGSWYYPIYTHYARNHFFYSRPAVYLTYRGGHSRVYFKAGFYAGNRPSWDGGLRGHDRNRPAQGPRPGMNHGGIRPGMNVGANPGGNRPGMGAGTNPGGNRPGMGAGTNPGGNRPGMGAGTNPGGNRGGSATIQTRPSTQQNGGRGGSAGGTRNFGAPSQGSNRGGSIGAPSQGSNRGGSFGTPSQGANRGGGTIVTRGRR